MSGVRTAVAIALLVLCTNALPAEEPPLSMEAILVVPDSRILPGVPFDFWIELHNRSDDVRSVRVCAPFQTRLISGEPFEWTETIDEMTRRDQLYWSHGGEAVVPPGGTALLPIPAHDGLMSGGFFHERSFSVPGRRFALRLALCEHVGIVYGARDTSPKLMTTEAEIEIVNPARSDAAVWKRIQEQSRQRWTAADAGSPEARAMWESVLRDFPDSNYVPYAILMAGRSISNDWRDQLAVELRAIERFPDSPVVEWLRIEAWGTARALRLRGVVLAEGAILRKSKRPTTRLLAFGGRAEGGDRPQNFR